MHGGVAVREAAATSISEPLLALGLGVVLGPAVTDVLSLPPLMEDHASLHEGTRILLLCR